MGLMGLEFGRGELEPGCMLQPPSQGMWTENSDAAQILTKDVGTTVARRGHSGLVASLRMCATHKKKGQKKGRRQVPIKAFRSKALRFLSLPPRSSSAITPIGF